MRILLLAVLVALLPPRAPAETVVAGFSQTSVAITTSFSGSEIFIYGAIRREAPPPAGPLDVIVAVTGPSTPVVVRKRERRLGVWVNGPAVQIDAAPSLYAVATTRPFRDLISYTDDMRHRVGLDEVIRLIDAPEWLVDRQAYRDAVVRVRRDQGLYFIDDGGVSLTQDTLFQTRVRLPANLTEGDYRARVFLLRGKAVVDVYETDIAVQKVGIERFIYALAQEEPLLYGIVSVLLALAAGWSAAALFRFFVP
ncbi:MAG: TIGR02186 family protein [Pseudomonadota bacterium]